MRPIKLVADSSADIPEELVRALDISIVPLAINIGRETYQETTLSRDAFWELARAGEHPRTSQPSIGAFETVFHDLIERGCDAICVSLTARHSGTFGSAWAAAKAFGERVRVIDSTFLSIAHGLQVIGAARMAMEGRTLEDIVGAIASLRDRTHLLIQLDTVEHLRRGGRAAMLMPVIDKVTRALKIKPILTLTEGELKLWGVVRTQAAAMQRMQQFIADLPSLEQLYVMHIRRPKLALALADQLCRVTDFDRARVFVGEAGAVLACHGGEGVLAVAGVVAA